VTRLTVFLKDGKCLFFGPNSSAQQQEQEDCQESCGHRNIYRLGGQM
jgi:hypothetical protein